LADGSEIENTTASPTSLCDYQQTDAHKRLGFGCHPDASMTVFALNRRAIFGS